MPSAERRDFYETLGIDRDATLDQVKSAYRKAALRHHPDRNPGDEAAEARFKEAAEAYSVLADPQKRALYDQYGHEGLAGRGMNGFDPGMFTDFEDLFGGLFGQFFGFDMAGQRQGGRRGARRGADLRFDLEIEFDEAIHGTEANIRVPHSEACGKCRGTGADSEADIVTCQRCSGTGQERFSKGFFTIARTCGQCRGQGRTIANPCTRCDGSGTVRQEKTLLVRIPAGIDHLSRMRITGAGDAGLKGGPPGDLYVFVSVKEHDYLRREGRDLVCTVPITFSQAALGAKLQLRTPHGEETITVPAGTQSGEVIRIRGKGVRDVQGFGRGDLLVGIMVRTPHKLSRQAKKRFQELSASGLDALSEEDLAVLDKMQ